MLMKALFLIPLVLATAYAQQESPQPATTAKGEVTEYGRSLFKPQGDIVEETSIHRQGEREIIVQRLAIDPTRPLKPVRKVEVKLPTPAAPLLEKETYDLQPSGILFLSATVYPGPATSLRWTHTLADGTTLEITGWSNIDFNHFSGISTFRCDDGIEQGLVMGIGNDHGENQPKRPTFSSIAPAFIPDQSNIPEGALKAIQALHKLYAEKGEILASGHASRQRVQAALKAELLANPPQPKNLILRYRIAETPSITTEKGGNK